MNFKTNKTRLIARVMLLVLLLTSALNYTACGWSFSNLLSEEPGDGLWIGFKWKNHDFGEYRCACTSDKREFDINDVTLIFYYGSEKEIQCNSFELCFENEDIYLLKEVTVYNPDDYIIEFNEYNIREFTHFETITIPKELFVNNRGHILFYIREIKSGEEGASWGGITLYYKLNGSTVLLSANEF